MAGFHIFEDKLEETSRQWSFYPAIFAKHCQQISFEIGGLKMRAT